MDSSVSVSKGCFSQKRRKGPVPSPSTLSGYPWHQAYSKSLNSLETLLNVQESRMFEEIFGSFIKHIKCNSITSEDEIPAAVLLTGVNMPDHTSLFDTLSKRIAEEVSPYVATLWSRDCSSLKVAVERMCSQLLRIPSSDDLSLHVSDDEDFPHDSQIDCKKIQRWNFNLQYLSTWYSNLKLRDSPQKKKKTNKTFQFVCDMKPLVIIIPDFESFSDKVLQALILLLKGYKNQLPFFLVLGVATAVSAVHRSLPYHVSSCLKMKVFHSQPSIDYLNTVLNEVFFLPNRPFHLGGKTFKLLMDVFLFHDFSVTGFIQGFKYSMIQHYFAKNWTVLSCAPSQLPSAVEMLTKDDVESIRALPSVRKHVEHLSSRADMISWLKDDNFVKEQVIKLLISLHEYILAFFASLRCLNVLTCSLPGAPLEKHLRSVYTLAMSCDIVDCPELRESMKYLSFLSSDELEIKLIEILSVLHEAVENGAHLLAGVTKKLEKFVGKFKTLWLCQPSTPTKVSRSSCKSPGKDTRSPTKSPLKSTKKFTSQSPTKSPLKSPTKLLLKTLKEISTQDVKQSPYEMLRTDVLKFLLEEIFTPFVRSPQTKPLHEVLFFDDCTAVKHRIVGSPRQAILRGLKDPHFYLDCDCCKLDDVTDILSSLPDVSIVYKLHLESGKLINMFDWLQSFLTIVSPSSTDDESDVDPMLQARFTRAVAELQFLGFIKSSNRKTDHVTRLTWC